MPQPKEPISSSASRGGGTVSKQRSTGAIVVEKHPYEATGGGWGGGIFTGKGALELLEGWERCAL